MRARTVSTLVLAAAVCLAAVGGPSRAQDEEPKRYDISLLDSGTHWEVGDRITVTHDQSMRMVMLLSRGEVSEPARQEIEERKRAVVVAECRELGEGGAMRTGLAHVATWEVSGRRGDDASLSGSTFDYEDGELHAKHTPSEPSPAARAWIRGTLPRMLKGSLAHDEAVDPFRGASDALLPDGPLAVGETWDIDPVLMLAAMDMQELPFVIDEDEGSVTGRLDAAEETDAATVLRISIEFDLPLRSMGGAGNEVELQEGALKMRMQVSGPMEGGRAPYSVSGSGTFTGRMEREGMRVEFDATISIERSKRPGGEIPELPASDEE